MHALVSVALLLASPASPSLTGTWLANGARLELVQDGSIVVGTLATSGGPCNVSVGTELLRGSLLDDSLAAQVRLCLLEPACGSDPGTALTVLLVTTQLTGGVSAQGSCAADVRALTLRKPGASQALALPPANSRLSHTAPPAPRKLVSPEPAAHIAERAHIEPAPARPAQLVHTEIDGPDSLLLRGLSELQEGRFESARKLFREALRKEPSRAEAANGIGVTFYARNDFDEALAWYKRAIETDPRFGDAYYNVACLYALQGQKPLALRYLRLAALNRYSDPEQMLNDPDLASLQGDPQLHEIVEQMSQGLKPSHPRPGAQQP